MIKLADLDKAKANATQQLEKARKDFVTAATPKLNDTQHQYIVSRALNDPAFFAALQGQFGSDALDKYLRQHSGGKK